MLIVVVNVVYLGVRVFTRLRYAPFGWTALALSTIWVVTILYGNMIGRFCSETKELEYSNSSIPEAFDGYRIVQISDLHLDCWEKHEDRLAGLVEKINALEPDLICFTGDLVSLSPDEIAPSLNILNAMKAKDGVISVLGNHDYAVYMRKTEEERAECLAKLVRIEKEELGWNLLMNEHVFLHRGGDSLAIIGCENQSLGIRHFVTCGDLTAAANGTEGTMRILLTHDPSQWRKEVVGATDIPLTLSGHTHALQMRIFGWTPSVFLFRECDGLYTEGEQSLYVNIGLGSGLPYRINAPAEITLITLSRGSASGTADQDQQRTKASGGLRPAAD